jgi:hypothetical protein
MSRSDPRTAVLRPSPGRDGRAFPARRSTRCGERPDTAGVRSIGRRRKIAGQSQESRPGGTQCRYPDKADCPACVLRRG